MQPISIDLLLHCQWVLPIVPNNQVLHNHSVAIDGGRIVEILATKDAQLKYIGLQTEELERHLLMPGLINTHFHSSSRLLRGIEKNTQETNLLDITNPISGKLLADTQFISDSTNIAIAEMIKTGTTCFAEMNSPGEVQVDIVRNTGIRSQIGFMLQEDSSAFGSNAEDYLHRGLKLRDNHSNHPLLKVAACLSNLSQIESKTLERLAAFANELDLPIQVQCNETIETIEACLKETGHRPLEHLNHNGLLLPETQLTGINHLNSEDHSLLEKTKNHVVIYPEFDYGLLDSNSLLEKLKQAEINPSLGTFDASGNKDLNLISAAKAAAIAIQKNDRHWSQQAAAHEALRMATINGAKTLDWESQIGSIEPNKAADLIAIEIDSIHHQPLYNPASQLVYSSNNSPVTHSWVAGQPLLKASNLCTLDEQKLIQSAKDWGKKLAN